MRLQISNFHSMMLLHPLMQPIHQSSLEQHCQMYPTICPQQAWNLQVQRRVQAR